MKKIFMYMFVVALVSSFISYCYAGGLLEKMLSPEKAKINELVREKETFGKVGDLKAQIFALRFINLLGLKKDQINQTIGILENAQKERIAKLTEIKNLLLVGEVDSEEINLKMQESNDALINVYDQLDGILSEKQKAKLKRLTSLLPDRVMEQLMGFGMVLMEELTKKGRLTAELGEEPLLSDEMMGTLMEFSAPALSLFNAINTKANNEKKLFIVEVLIKPECIQILKEKSEKMVEKKKGKETQEEGEN